MREAIRITAERAFEALSAEDQQAARQLFLRLVTPGEGQEDTRARAAMPAEPAQRKIVEQFAGPRTRLLVTGLDRARRPTVEVAHEALIRTWPRLRGWIDANREKLRARAAVLQAKADWEQNGRRDDMLLPAGLQLERARTLLADPGDITTDDIKEFIDESERRTRKFAPLVLPLVLVALFGLGCRVLRNPRSRPEFSVYLEARIFRSMLAIFNIPCDHLRIRILALRRNYARTDDIIRCRIIRGWLRQRVSIHDNACAQWLRLPLRVVLVAHDLHCHGVGDFGDFRAPDAANRGLVALVDFSRGPLWHAALALLHPDADSQRTGTMDQPIYYFLAGSVRISTLATRKVNR